MACALDKFKGARRKVLYAFLLAHFPAITFAEELSVFCARTWHIWLHLRMRFQQYGHACTENYGIRQWQSQSWTHCTHRGFQSHARSQQECTPSGVCAERRFCQACLLPVREGGSASLRKAAHLHRQQQMLTNRRQCYESILDRKEIFCIGQARPSIMVRMQPNGICASRNWHLTTKQKINFCGGWFRLQKYPFGWPGRS